MNDQDDVDQAAVIRQLLRESQALIGKALDKLCTPHPTSEVLSAMIRDINRAKDTLEAARQASERSKPDLTEKKDSPGSARTSQKDPQRPVTQTKTTGVDTPVARQ